MCALLQATALDAVAQEPDRRDPPAPTTFAKHVAPIIFEHCAACHRPEGSAPFSLLTYDAVRPRAAQIAAVTRTRAMPPWKAEPGDGPFIGQRPLSLDEIETLHRWVRDGAREGDAADLPSAPRWSDGWQLGTPDLVLTPEQTYTLPAGGADRFRVFVLPIPVTATRYVRGVEFRPHDPRVVHHANILLDHTSRSRERNEQDPGLGESGLLAATAEYPPGHLLGWTPGQPDPLLPKGLAWPLEPATDLVVQLHLMPDGRSHPVRFSVGLFFTPDQPERTPSILRLGRRDVDIPPGQRDYVIADSYVLPVDVEVLALKPHAHYRAREISGAAVLPDGSTRPLIHISDWDFRWQHVYRYVAPVALPKGTTLTMRVVYDNSPGNRRNPEQPPRRVAWGPRSTDEMGDLWIQVLAREQRDVTPLADDFQRKWIRDEVAGYETLIRSEEGSFSLRDEAAWLYLRMGRWSDATAHYEAAARLKPESALVHFNLATAQMLGGRLEDAITGYMQALRLKPDYAAARNNLGNVLSRLGRLDEALVQYRAAVSADPGHAGAHNNVGYLLMRRGDLDGARPYFDAAIRLDPRLPDAQYNLGLLLQARGDVPPAIAHFKRALAIDPDWVPALTALSWVLATTPDDRLRDGGEAIRLAARAVALTNRRSADALDSLGAAYAEAGQFDRALEALEEALRLASGTAAAASMVERRDLYGKRRPYRHSPRAGAGGGSGRH